jgi:hypothetical protein
MRLAFLILPSQVLFNSYVYKNVHYWLKEHSALHIDSINKIKVHYLLDVVADVLRDNLPKSVLHLNL